MKKNKDKNKKKKGFGKFLLGAAVGAGLGILFAPKKGSETRRELKEKLDELANKVKGIDLEDVKESIETKIAEIKEELSALDKEKALKIAKEKGKAIKKKSEELVDLAVKKGTPVLQKAAEEVREKAIEVVKEVLNKLEKKEK
ncbi:MAG: YtxH domain-containing protein [Bacilli bacterium]|nr:YtxH domain-containing protein [Bacilli bacterium]